MNMVSENQIKLRFARNYLDAKTLFNRNNRENANISAHYQHGRMDAIRQAYAEIYNISFDQAVLELDNMIIDA